MRHAHGNKPIRIELRLNGISKLKPSTTTTSLGVHSGSLASIPTSKHEIPIITKCIRWRSRRSPYLRPSINYTIIVSQCKWAKIAWLVDDERVQGNRRLHIVVRLRGRCTTRRSIVDRDSGEAFLRGRSGPVRYCCVTGGTCRAEAGATKPVLKGLGV